MKRKIFVALDNIRSAQNVGSIIRTSNAFNIDKLFLCGITPTPSNSKVLKTSLGAEKSVKWKYSKNIKFEIEKLKNKGVQIVSLEQTEKSIDIDTFKIKKDICLIVGNEMSGVSDEILKISDQHINIPMKGAKESLNVSVAFGIAVYDISKKLG